MADVFISYARKDLRVCRDLASRMRGLGLKVWFDAALESGKEFPKELERELRAASCVLVLWSEAAAKSDWVCREVRIGIEEKKLCSVSIDQCAPPSPYHQIHTLPLPETGFAWNEDAWLRILDRIGALTSRRGLSYLAQAHAEGEPLPGGGGVFECKSIRQLRADGGKGSWESRRIASRLVSLDYAAYENLNEKDEGTIDHWEAIIDHTPESFGLLLMQLPGQTSMIVGSWSVFSVSKRLFRRLKTGWATSDNLKLSELRRIEPGEGHYLFFDNISTHPELSGASGASSKLVRSIGQTYKRWRQRGVGVTEVVGHQYAKVGRDLADLYGLEKLKRGYTRYGDIYTQTGAKLDKRLIREWR